MKILNQHLIQKNMKTKNATPNLSTLNGLINCSIPNPIPNLCPFPPFSSYKELSSKISSATYLLINPDDAHYTFGTEELTPDILKEIEPYYAGELNYFGKILPIYIY